MLLIFSLISPFNYWEEKEKGQVKATLKKKSVFK